ncbi:MAG: 5-oxoprolinase/urea amidolyase family protein, partial [Hyphomonadaceae bacterium]
ARVETWIETGTPVSAHYDPMLAKVIVTAPDRPAAVAAMQRALAATRVEGLQTNLAWLRDVAASAAFVSGAVSTRALEDVAHRPRGMRVVSGGLSASVQAYPGRLGYWAVGVPPSGPMDALAFRLGNRQLGNAEGAAGVEFAAMGPSVTFLEDAVFCLAGAAFAAHLDDAPVAVYAPTAAKAGQTLKIGRLAGAGQRGYLLVRGGVDAPNYLGSAATFALGGFGGPHGRGLAAGDVLHFGPAPAAAIEAPLAAPPALAREWRVRALYGPHGAPDFFTEEDIALIASAEWRVHFNSSRTGVRLIGPKPRWARGDGGEAGLHPSNIHDNPYAIGAVDFTGDMPILLGPDGPSLGGFVCPFVTIAADLWKLGQLAPGDVVRFAAVSEAEAAQALAEEDDWVRTLRAPTAREDLAAPCASPILAERAADGTRPRAVYRRQGDDNVLIEYGPIALDIELRLRVHALMEALAARATPGVIDVTPGIRSLQVHHDPRVLAQARLLEILAEIEEGLGGLDDFEIESRIVWLPLSWRDPAITQTIEKYMASVRDDAPWTPDNIEFIRRVNGLDDIEDVRRIVFDASYLVLGLGDVYLGAPVATPIDPRHRLVTTKYNPARTWTPPNVVGIGGAYMCIYGMEGPGGYQLFGRTIQVWNSHRQTADFIDGKPWLLRFFDQIRFFPVSAAELEVWRREFPSGRRALKVEQTAFRLRDYRRMLAENAESIAVFETQRAAAFAAERADWERRGEFARAEALETAPVATETPAIEIPDGCELMEAALGGAVWRVLAGVGDRVEAGAPAVIIEAMKTECEAPAPVSGVVRAVYVREKQMISSGAPLMAIEPQ